jgi:hypothetical protein
MRLAKSSSNLMQRLGLFPTAPDLGFLCENHRPIECTAFITHVARSSRPKQIHYSPMIGATRP